MKKPTAEFDKCVNKAKNILWTLEMNWVKGTRPNVSPYVAQTFRKEIRKMQHQLAYMIDKVVPEDKNSE